MVMVDGLFGLNVYSGKATFKSVVNFNSQYSYNGNGSLTVLGDSKQVITSLYNKTLSNTKIDREFFTSNGRSLVIDAAYLELLPVGVYTFKAVGNSSAYEFTVNVTGVSQTVIEDMVLEQGCNAVIYLGNVEVESVSVNGNLLTAEQYEIRNYMLTVKSEFFSEGENQVVINGGITITVTLI